MTVYLTHDQYFHVTSDPGRTLQIVWTAYFKKPIDDFENHGSVWIKLIKEYIFGSNWHEVYEIIEFIMDYWNNSYQKIEFSELYNAFLEKELSGYRIVNGIFTPITDKVELAEIDQALESNDKTSPVRLQLEEALKKLSNKDNPDFRGSIKDSISAVETLCRQISNDPKLELTKALKSLERTGKIQIHGALQNGFSSLYGWTSDDQGIRHGLMEEPNLTFDDAKYMLVSCSAFINYLIAKAAKAGIELK